jgi:hypothetical protein
VPKGYYLKGPGQVAPCPKGEYKDTTGAAASCTKCVAGVTTEAEASIAETACKVLLPTFYAATLSTDNIVKATKKCPQKYFCPGGNPTAAFQPSAPTTLAGTTVVQCADGTWTENIGASSADQCSEYHQGCSTAQQCALRLFPRHAAVLLGHPEEQTMIP